MYRPAALLWRYITRTRYSFICMAKHIGLSFAIIIRLSCELKIWKLIPLLETRRNKRTPPDTTQTSKIYIVKGDDIFRRLAIYLKKLHIVKFIPNMVFIQFPATN